MQLPIELWEAIIVHCQDDPPSLLSCALVCKAWLPKSRHLIFNRCVVPLCASDTDVFCDLPHTLKAHIATIELSGDSYAELDGYQDVDGLLRLSQAVIDGCTSLKSLKLCDGAATALPLFSTSLPLSSSLTTLRLWGSLQDCTELPQYSLKAGKLLDLIGNFTVLENLSMNYDTPGRYITDTVDPAGGIGRNRRTTLEFLRNLELDLPWSVFSPLFLIPGVLCFPSVEKLEISFSYLRNRDGLGVGDRLALPLIQPYLELFSSSLQELILVLGWDNIPGAVPSLRIAYPLIYPLLLSPLPSAALNLRHFKTLRSILFVVEPEEEFALEHFQELCDIARSTREGGGEGKGKRIGEGDSSDPQPLTVIVTIHEETVKAPNIEGVTWILDKWYGGRYEYEDRYRYDYDYLDEDADYYYDYLARQYRPNYSY